MKTNKLVALLLSIILISSCGEITRKIASKVVKRTTKEVVDDGSGKLSKKSFNKGVKEFTQEISEKRTKDIVLKTAEKTGNRVGTKILKKVTRLVIKSKNQYINMSEYLKWAKNNPALLNTLELGYKKDPTILRRNMERVMGKNYKYAAKGGNQAHHIVGGGQESAIARHVLEKFHIDINDPLNGILLPCKSDALLKGTIHSGGHTKKYFQYVNERLNTTKSKSEALEILDDIKNELYKGKLDLYNSHIYN